MKAKDIAWHQAITEARLNEAALSYFLGCDSLEEFLRLTTAAFHNARETLRYKESKISAELSVKTETKVTNAFALAGGEDKEKTE